MQKITLKCFSSLLVILPFAIAPLEVCAASDKDGYHLFSPTPTEMMREMSTDRPDKTESAYTVDAGHYQIEMSLIDYSYDHRNPDRDDTRTDTLNLVPVNLKAGLTNNIDLQLIIEPYIKEEIKGIEKKRGFGDVQTRLKINLWGNDDGPTALAVMPFLKFPTNTDGLGNDALEGGIIIPLAVALPQEWSMGLMTEFDFNESEEGHYFTEFVNTMTLGHQIAGDLSGYVEFFSSFNKETDSPWVGTVDLGLTYGLTKDIQLDGGVNIGVTRSSDDFNPFCGLSMRY